MGRERLSFSWIMFIKNMPRERSIQPPSDKQVTPIVVKVRQFSLVFRHDLLGRPKGLPYQDGAVRSRKFS
jgi:hypothetical protein